MGWWKACRTDPGIITPMNAEELCKICEIAKPARSKHCGLCNVCVARFDHHCIWLNNCVGVGNHKWFLAFLLTHLVLCLYGCGAGTCIAYSIIQKKDLLKAVFVDP